MATGVVFVNIKKQSIIKVWKSILKPHIYNIFSIQLLWKVILQHAKFPWIWRSLPINYRIVCTFFFSFILLCIFIPDKATLFRIKNNRRKNEPSRGRRKCLKCEGIKIKSSQSETTFKYCFYYFPNTHQFQHSSSDTEQLSTSVFIAPAVIMLFCFVSATRSLSRGS